MRARWGVAAVIVDVVVASWADAVDRSDVGGGHEIVDVTRRPDALN